MIRSANLLARGVPALGLDVPLHGQAPEGRDAPWSPRLQQITHFFIQTLPSHGQEEMT